MGRVTRAYCTYIIVFTCRYTSKSSGTTDKKLQEVEKQLAERINRNVKYAQKRFADCCLRKVENASEEATGQCPTPIDSHVRSLIESAASEEKLSMMPSSFQAWL